MAGSVSNPFRIHVAASAAAPAGPLPQWVPSPGERANVSLNTMADVDPCPARNCAYSRGEGQRGVFANWCGGAFSQWFSRYGALICHGGGHGGYCGNEVYAFDLEKREWMRLNDPYPGPYFVDASLHPGASRNSLHIADHLYGEFWLDADLKRTAVGQPAPSHTYDQVAILSPDAGGGPKGSLVVLNKSSLPHGGSVHSHQSHACDLASGNWSRYSSNLLDTRAPRGGSDYDPARKVFWFLALSGDTHMLDTASRSWRRLDVPAIATDAEITLRHSPDRDILLAAGRRVSAVEDSALFAWLDCSNTRSGWQRVNAPFPADLRMGAAVDYCPPLRCWVAYNGRGADYVLKFIPPDGEPGGRWTVEKEALRGPEPARRKTDDNGPYSRFRWVPALRSFVWADDPALPVQLWRLRGT